MPSGTQTGRDLMGKAAKTTHVTTGDPFLDDPEGLVALAVRSFAAAKDEAIEENDRLGIPSYGAVNGKIVVRSPSAAKKSSGPTG